MTKFGDDGHERRPEQILIIEISTMLGTAMNILQILNIFLPKLIHLNQYYSLTEYEMTTNVV